MKGNPFLRLRVAIYHFFALEQGFAYYDIRGLLGVVETAATEPTVQSVGLYLLSWGMFAATVSCSTFEGNRS